MKTLLIDGDWNLKRNFKKRSDLYSRGEHCGGSYGALESIRSIVNRMLPDRVIVFWDGIMSGKLRKDYYPPYKENRNKSWDEETYYFSLEEIDEIKQEKHNILQQKIKVKNYLEELFIRQVEVDYIEADDLIAFYVLKKLNSEHVFIFSSDKDFYQLIQRGVSVIRPSDGLIIGIDNFKNLFGYTILNSLFLRCFEGDKSDNIDGIRGVTLNQLKKFFPKFLEEKYTLDKIIEEATALYEQKKYKVLESIINCRKTMERNRTLMNLKRPFVTEEAKREVMDVSNYPIVDPDNPNERSIQNAMRMLVGDGFKRFLIDEDINFFFRPFYRLMTKEKEYTKSLLES